MEPGLLPVLSRLMEITIYEQLAYNVHHAEQQVEQQRNRPDASQEQIAAQEKELQILKSKLALQPK